MDDNIDHVEDGIQAPLLGHDTDGKLPLRLHRNAWTAQFADFLWRNRWLAPLFAVILAAGVFLGIQARQGEISILLLMLFAWGMILIAILARINN